MFVKLDLDPAFQTQMELLRQLSFLHFILDQQTADNSQHYASFPRKNSQFYFFNESRYWREFYWNKNFKKADFLARVLGNKVLWS
ncbi:hypothetical protein B9G79_16180 [Bdellovibrio bacteriovorus]|uniref:Uncharacterized protein n=1 Tax=Bdellovibrio bacteriovorus TaxID=959 RepID=A0A1Z3NC26_BDEBC|nr:hypothetical protein B9G79_16180 [Bdellovibrio bacteriovorus]